MDYQPVNRRPGTILTLGLIFLWAMGWVHGQQVIRELSSSALQTAIEVGGTIRFEVDGTLLLSEPLVISEDVILDGTGHQVVFSGQNITHHATIQRHATARFKNITFDSGKAVEGGSLRNEGGEVYLEDCRFTHNLAEAGLGENACGGAVFNDGDGVVFMVGCTFSGNRSLGGLGRSGKDGEPGVIGSGAGTAGQAGLDGGAAFGGAICNFGTLSVTNTLFSLNQALGGNGGHGGDGGTGFGPGTAGGAGAAGGDGGNAFGGAIHNQGQLVVSETAFLGNAIRSGYGGNGGDGGKGTTFGGQSGSGGAGGVAGSAGGGAVFSTGSAARSDLTNCTLTLNEGFAGGGGQGGDGGSNGIPGNGANGGNGGDAMGGGVMNESSGRVTLLNCSVANNFLTAGLGGNLGKGGKGGLLDTVDGTSGTAGSAGERDGGNVFNESGMLNLQNTFVTLTGSLSNCGGTITDLGRNLSSDTSCNLSGQESDERVNLELGPLLDTFPPVLSLTFRSPAIDVIRTNTLAPIRDQRGVLRTALPDVGAYEFVLLATTLPVSGIGAQTAVLSGRGEGWNLETQTFFEWREAGSGSAWNATPQRLIQQFDALEAHLELLRPDTRYEYRMVMVKGGLRSDGAIVSFETLALAGQVSLSRSEGGLLIRYNPQATGGAEAQLWRSEDLVRWVRVEVQAQMANGRWFFEIPGDEAGIDFRFYRVEE